MPLPRLLSRLGFRSNLLDPWAALWLTVGATVIGTLGFVLIEGYSVVDGLYMTIITISTVGYGEVEPLSPTGRLFVSILVMLNVAIVAYALATFSYYVIEGKLFELMERNRMQDHVNALEGHTILCGFGRYGKEIARHLLVHGQDFVIIEEKENKINNGDFEGADIAYVVGDATDDATLIEAGIHRAQGLITALSDDSDNLFIVLSAKDLNAQLRIISRAHQARSRAKMMKAGASHVIMPEQIGGFYMATLISKPGAVEFFSYVTNDLASDIGFEEIRYDQLPPKMQGMSIKELGLRKHSGINIIGHRFTDG
ncbi:MAG: potassium channel family protein, partial [Bacteroidota bacterium]